MPDLSTPLLDAANAKLLNPTMDCASLDLSSGIGSVMSEAKPDDGNAAPSVIYYPSFDSASCLHDGVIPAWLQESDKFESAQVS